MSDPFAHLNALRIRLSHEQDRLRNAKARDIALRQVWVAQIEREIAAEIKFLADRGIVEPEIADMSDEDLLSELSDIDYVAISSPGRLNGVP